MEPVKKIGLWGLLLTSLCVIQPALAVISPEAQNRLSVVQGTLATTPAPVVGNLSVSGQFDQAQYYQGGFATVAVAVGQPAGQRAHVALVQAYPDGRVVQLFPNACQPVGEVTGSNRFEIKGCTADGRGIDERGLWVNDGPGTYLVKLIASTDVGALNSLLSISRAEELSDRLQRGNYAGTVWSVDAIAYTVVDSAGQTGVQQPVPPVISQQPGTVPINWANIPSDFNLSLQLQGNRSTYRLGESLVFSASAEQTCELGLVEITPSGAATAVYPNSFEEIKLKSGRMSWFPAADSKMRIVVREVGTSTYLAICSKKPGFLDGFFGLFSSKSTPDTKPMVPAQGTRAAEIKPVISVEALMRDDPNNQEARAWVSVQVVQ
jgi:Domain of unknown function (DUF4384)